MIVPALLTDKRRSLIDMVGICEKFAPLLQIDIMDGEFVPSKSVGLSDLSLIKPRTNSEAHLMVKKPLEWVEAFKKIGSSRIIFHAEISEDIVKIIKEIHKEGLQAGIAVNPGTQIKDFAGLIDQVDAVLFMSVHPGFYGAAFIPEVLEKIKKFKLIYPDKTAGIDGGIKPDNILEVKNSGVDYICVGSAILKAASPETAYKELVKKVYG